MRVGSLEFQSAKRGETFVYLTRQMQGRLPLKKQKNTRSPAFARFSWGYNVDVGVGLLADSY